MSNDKKIIITTAANLAPRRTKRRAKQSTIKIQVDKPPSSQTNRNRRLRRRAATKQTKNAGFTASRAIQKCTAEYASALVNPFGARKTLPCIPDTICIPSNKYMAKARGVFSTGALGMGFVSLDPFLMCKSDGGNGPSTSSIPVIYTTPAYAGEVFNPTVTDDEFVTGVAGQNGNAQYTDAFINAANRQMRLVAAGLKIQYIGSNFRNQGRIALARSQGNAAYLAGTSFGDVLNDNYTVMIPVSRKAEYVFFVPDDHNFFNYLNFFDAYDPNADATNSHRSMLIMIEGGDLETPQSWSFEAVAYFELVGPNVTLSPSSSDPEGMGKTMESLPVKNPTSVPSVVQATVLNRIYNKLQEAAFTYGPSLLNAGTNYMMSQLGRDYSSQVTIEDAD